MGWTQVPPKVMHGGMRRKASRKSPEPEPKNRRQFSYIDTRKCKKDCQPRKVPDGGTPPEKPRFRSERKRQRFLMGQTKIPRCWEYRPKKKKYDRGFVEVGAELGVFTWGGGKGEINHRQG